MHRIHVACCALLTALTAMAGSATADDPEPDPPKPLDPVYKLSDAQIARAKQWVKDLAGKDADKQTAAGKALRLIGPGAMPFVKKLVGHKDGAVDMWADHLVRYYRLLAEPLECGLRMQPAYSSFDAIDFYCGLIHYRRRAITFEMGGRKRIRAPQLLLTPSGAGAWLKVPRRKERNKPSVVENPEQYETVDDFSGDLRTFYGPLPPGTYRFQMIYPAGSYEIRGLPGIKPIDLRSNLVEFTVTRTTLAEAEKANTHVPGIHLTPGGTHRLSSGRIVRRATIVNRGKAAVSFTAYTYRRSDIKPHEPLQALIDYDRWAPPKGWRPNRAGWCGTGLGGFTLAPGKGQVLWIRWPDDDGIYRLSLDCSIVVEGKPKDHTVHSKAFHLRDGKPHPAK